MKTLNEMGKEIFDYMDDKPYIELLQLIYQYEDNATTEEEKQFLKALYEYKEWCDNAAYEELNQEEK